MKYDLHTHTYYSKCAGLKPEILLKQLKKKKFDGAAITDHNSIKGAIDVKKLNKDRDFEVILGTEITTDKGDILVLDINQEIRSRNFMDVIDEAKKQDAIIIVPHPFRTISLLRFRYPLAKLKYKVDAIETINARMLPFENKIAHNAALKEGFAEVGGSDGHFWFDIGRAWTEFTDDLRKDLKKKRTKAYGNTNLALVAAGCSFIKKRFRLRGRKNGC